MPALTANVFMSPDCPWAVARTMVHANGQQTPTASIETIGVFPYRYMAGNALSTAEHRNSIETLGWSKADALETLLRLRTFAEDWDQPEMEAYDDL